MTLRHHMTTGIALLLTVVVPSVASAGFTTWSSTSAEPSVYEILDDMYGLDSLERMHDFDADATDQLWGNAGLVQVSVLAKYSRMTQNFGFMAGESGKVFTSLFEVNGTGRGLSYESSFDVGASDQTFRFTNDPIGDRVASSRMTENAFGADQMVTWRVGAVSGLDTYVIAFEDRPGRPASADFNDLIIQVQLGRGAGGDDGSGAEPVPEPATLILLGMGAAGLAVSRRKKR